MSILHVIILAIIQGLAELLPISSSAHVVVAEKLMGLDPSAPQMTLLLVMLHTGTMFAVIVHFWKTWKKAYFSSTASMKRVVVHLACATAFTGVIAIALKTVLEETLFYGSEKAEIEQLFSHLEIIAPALAAVGILILIAGLVELRLSRIDRLPDDEKDRLTLAQAVWMGAVQGFALPFRGFSRSGSTISTGMLAGAAKEPAEHFSFALAIVLTPPVIGAEVVRLLKAVHESAASGTPIDLHASLLTSLLGAVFSFFAGLLALKWLSRWLESGRWYWFGIYCLVASAVMFYLYRRGF